MLEGGVDTIMTYVCSIHAFFQQNMPIHDFEKGKMMKTVFELEQATLSVGVPAPPYPRVCEISNFCDRSVPNSTDQLSNKKIKMCNYYQLEFLLTFVYEVFFVFLYLI
jgi:hypothetical protein